MKQLILPTTKLAPHAEPVLKVDPLNLELLSSVYNVKQLISFNCKVEEVETSIYKPTYKSKLNITEPSVA